MSQAVQNLIHYVVRALQFFVDLIKKLFGIANEPEVSE